MDIIDIRILNALQQDASIPQRRLAEFLHISAATVLRRVERLKQQGYIEREVAILNPEKLGASLQVIAEVTLDKQDSLSQDTFENAIACVNAVQQCYRVSAGPDFILMLTVSHMQAYRQLAHQIFTSEYNVRNVRAFFCTHRVKFTSLIPLPEMTFSS